MLTFSTDELPAKMSESETRSVTEWEKANPQAMEACSTEAGWKGK